MSGGLDHSLRLSVTAARFDWLQNDSTEINLFTQPRRGATRVAVFPQSTYLPLILWGWAPSASWCRGYGGDLHVG
jgi:hypothetical protein